MSKSEIDFAIRANNEVVRNLEQARLQTELLLDQSLEHMVFFNKEGLLIHANKTFTNFHDLSLNELRFKSMPKLIGYDSWKVFSSKVSDLTEGKEHYCETLIPSKQGERRFYWLLRSYLSNSAYGTLYQASGRDITDYEIAKARMEQIYSLLPIGILTVDIKGNIEGLYSTFTEVLLCNLDISGQSLRKLIFDIVMEPQDPQVLRFKELLSQLGKNSNQADSDVITIKTKGNLKNDAHWLQIACFPIVVNDSIQKMFFTIQNATHTVIQEKENERLREASLKDALTGVANRRSFDQALDLSWRSFGHSNDILGIFMIDVDFFKNYNDRYGHPAGDACLQNVAKALADACKRARDLVFRYGGEEFVILAWDGELGAFERMMDYFRQSVEALNISHEARKDSMSKVTISLGALVVEPKIAKNFTKEQAMELADKALYESKKSGRNKGTLYYLK